jgi:hypothetical protein
LQRQSRRNRNRNRNRNSHSTQTHLYGKLLVQAQTPSPCGVYEKQELLCPFERNLLTALILRRRTGRPSDAEDQQPEARNHVSELMRIVGV